MATSKDDDEAESDHVANKRSSSSESSDSSEQGSESSSEPGSISAPPTLPIQRPSLSLRWDSIDTDEPKCRDFGIRDYLTATNESLDAEEESSMAGDFNTGLGVPPPRFSIDSLDATTALLLDTHVKDRNQHDHDRLASSGRAPKSLRKSLSLPHAAASFSPNLPKIHEIQKIAVAKPPEDSSSHQQPIELLDMDTIRSQKRRVTVDLNTSGRRCGTWEG